MYVTKQSRGMGDLQPLTFSFLDPTPCQVGALDPVSGDTIANCPPAFAGANAPPIVSDSMTVTAAGYPTWAYVAAGALGVFLLGSLFGGGRRRY